MRITVLSDSHGDIFSLDRALGSVGKTDMIIHLGDIARDVDYLKACYSDIPISSVLGNNDFLRSGDFEKTVEIDGKKIFICHGHTLGVHRGTDELTRAASREGAQIALFGHTHRAVLKEDEPVILLNPGSTSRPRDGAASFAVIEYDGSFKPVIVDWVL